MKTKKFIMGAGATIVAFGLALPASALTVDGTFDATGDAALRAANTVDLGASADANGAVQSSSTGSGSAGAGVSGSAKASADTDTSIGGSIKAMLSGLVNGSVSNKTDPDAADNATVSDEASASGSLVADIETILVTRADLEGGKVEATSDNALLVESDADLRGFIAAQVQNDSRVDAIEYASDKISVTYDEKAKLFALVPVTIQATATVDAQGNVEVSYPWYSFLMSTNKDAIEAKVQQRIQSAFSAMADTGADARAIAAANASVTADDGSVRADANSSAEAAAALTAQAQARLIAEVKAAMADALAEADAASDMTASVDADADADGSVHVR